MSESQSALTSWLSLNYYADGQNDGIEASTIELANEDGTQLREEVTYDSLEGVDAVDWGESTDRFLSWYADHQDTAVVVENEHGETASFSQPCRFAPEHREM